jgi:hypothetical protein
MDPSFACITLCLPRPLPALVPMASFHRNLCDLLLGEMAWPDPRSPYSLHFFPPSRFISPLGSDPERRPVNRLWGTSVVGCRESGVIIPVLSTLRHCSLFPPSRTVRVLINPSFFFSDVYDLLNPA